MRRLFNWVCLRELKHRKWDAVSERSLIAIGIALGVFTVTTAARQGPTTIPSAYLRVPRGGDGAELSDSRLVYQQEELNRRVQQLEQMLVPQRLALLERAEIQGQQAHKEVLDWQRDAEKELRQILVGIVLSMLALIAAQVIQIREARHHRRTQDEKD